ncbi:MAG: ADP-ribosylglycohydrolase family protein [Prolixibacteraceae bacterium]|nr:ADP-ribosylglycohydrolase family protein [Prolixibacteraceae bacterium]
MKALLCLLSVLTIMTGCRSRQIEKNNSLYENGETVKISKEVLIDKIKGGWAGQVIGCTYGGPTEFRWNGTFIGDEVPLQWDETRMLWYFDNQPGLYDDVYMDLTFVEVFEKYGLDAHDSLHALAFANAEYPLWHANQAARYNILNGIMPPASGHWKNNPHADDIDFQIEADFAGLMSPGMPNSAAEISNRIGHIMNYGDGVYGGIYVAAMYSLAFIYDDIEVVVKEALKTIPAESEFCQCISDVINWHERYPDDWKRAWFEAQKRWTYDKGCPNGVLLPFNIDAKINAAYIVTGLLYGKGDFGATVDISTRCGYDSDCKPANAAGILGAILGYSNIPDFWKQGIEKVENRNFRYTGMSLRKVYDTGYRHAAEMVRLEGGNMNDTELLIKYQSPETVPSEVSFEGLFPTSRYGLRGSLSGANPEFSININGCGFVVTGRSVKDLNLPDISLEIDVYADENFVETVKMPTASLTRRPEVAWNYELPEGDHKITLKARNIPEGYSVDMGDLITYSTIDPGKRVYF